MIFFCQSTADMCHLNPPGKSYFKYVVTYTKEDANIYFATTAPHNDLVHDIDVLLQGQAGLPSVQ